MPITKERASRSQQAKRLKRVRARLDLSQRELSAELRVGAAAIALPRDWIFANRLQWDLFAVLALLEAESN